MKVLVTGETIFVSKYVASYFLKKGHDVYTLNRGTHLQVKGVKHIKANRHELGSLLKEMEFDVILDISVYDELDVKDMLNSGVSFKDYILISSSAVYPQTLKMPFTKEEKTGKNDIWGTYGINKIAAENYLLNCRPDAYILRPPYLYGPMQNLYRKPFVFDCAELKRKFYIPKYGKMKLQFFHVNDLCIVIEEILKTHPNQHIFNVGNESVVDINTYVELCYQIANAKLEKVYVTTNENQRNYFLFYDYEYILNVDKMKKLLPKQKDLYDGLRNSYEWYCNHMEEVYKKLLISYIEEHMKY